MTTSATLIRTVPTFWVEICIAGPIDVAKQVIRRHLAEVGLCVTVKEADYLYTFGEESGYIVRLINYPRFPSTKEELNAKALELAEKLLEGTGQGSFTLINPFETTFYSRRPADVK